MARASGRFFSPHTRAGRLAPADGPVMLLLQGMPTWAYLYRRCI